ncbi:hypothetical protein J0X19_11795 [Hymenobacter sp. BT186]|uniref:Uncharacterized protein n=1 Tax=Hymenobacter telluris TaxID=2816474 RepID=A0A939JCR1_9BACT|nr:hypothetical protein [Hymenobacter telluris]MBO0358630.1 hypothetical protein [Hymenobacter telluris]MBW3374656.1 hypothetical protein [Hymenobacter norwichensis]
MPTNPNIIMALKSYADFSDEQEDRKLRRAALEQDAAFKQAQIELSQQKAGQVDLADIAKNAFYKAASGMPVSEQEMGLARAFDASRQQIYTDPLGNQVTRPSVLDRMGGNTLGGMMQPPTPTLAAGPTMGGVMGVPPIQASELPPLPNVPGTGGVAAGPPVLGFDPNTPPPDFKGTPISALERVPVKANVMAGVDPSIASSPVGQKAEMDATIGINTAAVKASAEENAKVEAGALGKMKNTGVTLDAFEQLRDASKAAPSGLLQDLKATFSNKANIKSDAAKAQGVFSVKKANAENMIRQTFKVVGSGATSDRDALPFIQMLPDEKDSSEVKDAKITAAMSALKRQANTLASQRGLPSPFPDDAPAAPATVDYTEYFK